MGNDFLGVGQGPCDVFDGHGALPDLVVRCGFPSPPPRFVVAQLGALCERHIRIAAQRLVQSGQVRARKQIHIRGTQDMKGAAIVPNLERPPHEPEETRVNPAGLIASRCFEQVVSARPDGAELHRNVIVSAREPAPLGQMQLVREVTDLQHLVDSRVRKPRRDIQQRLECALGREAYFCGSHDVRVPGSVGECYQGHGVATKEATEVRPGRHIERERAPLHAHIRWQSRSFATAPLAKRAPSQHVVAMVLEELPLTLGEGADIRTSARVDTHLTQRRRIRDGRHNEIALVLE